MLQHLLSEHFCHPFFEVSLIILRIVEMIDGRADLVVCDGAPDVTGLHDIDEYIQVARHAFLKCTLQSSRTPFPPRHNCYLPP